MKQKCGYVNQFGAWTTLCLLIGIIGVSSAYAEKKTKLSPGDLPSEVRQAVKTTFPDSVILEAEKEEEGEDPGQLDLLIQSGGKKYEVEMSADGTMKEKKEVSSNNDEEDEDEEEGEAKAASGSDKKWTESFDLKHCSFATVGKNPFFILEPGFQLVLASEDEMVTITVLNETKEIGDVETRVVEEREAEDGQIKEVSRNFFAQCRETGDVFYFGEEVDEYEDGKIATHSGAWRADEPDSKAGIIMPGRILMGARHYQEIAPNAKDRAEIVADDVTLKTPAGEFKNCVRVEETSGLNPKEKCYKVYAPGIGLIQDEDLLLVSHGKAKQD